MISSNFSAKPKKNKLHHEQQWAELKRKDATKYRR